MRCKICNEALTTGESVTKDHQTDKFLDTCHKCTSVVNKTLYEYDLSIVIDRVDKKE